MYLSQATGVGHAGEWYLTPQLQLQAGYDTNVTFSTSDPKDAFSGGIAPEFELGRRTETLDVSVSGRYSITGYTPHSELNKPGAKQFALQGSKLFERSRLAASLGWRSNTIFNTVDDADTDVQISQPVTVESLSSLVGWSYRLSEISTLDLVAGYSDTKYDSPNFTNSRSHSFSANFAHQVSEIDTLLLNTSALRRSSDDAGNTVNRIVGVGIGWRHLFSERLWAQGTVGPQFLMSESEIMGDSQSNNTVGYSLDARAFYAVDELSRINIGFSHQSEPGSGISGTVTRDRAQFTYGRDLTPRLSLLFAAGLTRSDLANEVHRDVYSVEPNLTWRLDQEWDLKSSYRFRASETRSSQGTSNASSHAVMFALTWHPLSWIWSD